MKRLLSAAVLFVGVVTAAGGAYFWFGNQNEMSIAEPQAACGKVSIADMNWASATLMAHVDAFILEHGYGCDTDIVTGDTMPTGTSMVEKGEPDIAPEFWTNNFKEALAKGIAEKRLIVLGDALSDGGEEGFWVPDYLVAKDPSLATIEGVIKNAKMFTHPEDPEKSAFMTCPAGWGCQVTNGHLYEALNLEGAGFDLVDSGSGAALAATIAKAFERKQPWFGYYWAPTSVLGKYNMVKVDFGVTDRDHFDKCLTQEICENPKPSMYPPSPVKTLAVQSFVDREPGGAKYLSNRSYSNALMNGLLAWGEENQADGDTAAAHFLNTHSDVWKTWVPANIAVKVSKSLAEM
jgi:glycine betaine/proline transport system substrate-binding protein